MTIRTPVYVAAAASLAVALAGCGGSKEAAPQSETAAAEAPADTGAAEAPAETAPAVEAAGAADAPAETTEEVVDDTAAAADDIADKTANMMDQAGDAAAAVGEAVENAAAAAGDAAATVVAAAASAATDLVGDAAKGKRVFVKCMSCHTVQEGQNRVGPSLYQIVGREAGSVAGFAYSEANKNSGITWTEDVLFAYLENPQAYIPGTKMVFPGLPSAQDRVDVIAYLKNPQ